MDLNKIVDRYKTADDARAWGQIAQTLAAFIPLGVVMYQIQKIPYGWIGTLALSPVMALLLMKWFTIQHDCGHQSFFKEKWLNDLVGGLISPLVATPYKQWAAEHAKHHATSGHLDHRGVGDVDTWTVEEYKKANRFWRLYYRVYRNPIFLFGFGSFLHFLVLQRVPWYQLKKFETWRSVMLTNLGMTLVFLALAFWIGVGPLLLIWLPSLYLASMLGTWFFFVQHQFPETYWAKSGEWTHTLGSVKGSSFYDLDPVMHWFTGNIGYHHIHHLNSRIPNYKLPECYRENREFHAVTKFGFFESLKCARLALWDEKRRRLVSFAEGLA